MESHIALSSVDCIVKAAPLRAAVVTTSIYCWTVQVLISASLLLALAGIRGQSGCIGPGEASLPSLPTRLGGSAKQGSSFAHVLGNEEFFPYLATGSIPRVSRLPTTLPHVVPSSPREQSV